jgi:hypothetical protein
MDMTSSFQVMERPCKKLVKTKKRSTSSSTCLFTMRDPKGALRDPEDAVLKSVMNARVQLLLRFMYASLQIIISVMSVLRVWIITSCQHYLPCRKMRSILDALVSTTLSLIDLHHRLSVKWFDNDGIVDSPTIWIDRGVSENGLGTYILLVCDLDVDRVSRGICIALGRTIPFIGDYPLLGRSSSSSSLVSQPTQRRK